MKNIELFSIPNDIISTCHNQIVGLKIILILKIGNSITSSFPGVFYISNDFIVNFGGPQSLYLGPLLFILFLNDLPSIFDRSVDILLFADDAKIFSIIKSPEDPLLL